LEILILSASTVDGPTVDCDFELSVDGAGFVPANTTLPGPPSFNLDDSATFVEIKAAPRSSEFWPLSGRFKLLGPGNLVKTDAPDDIEPPRGVAVAGIGTIVISFHLSRLRDASDDVLVALGKVPAKHVNDVPAPWPPARWETPKLHGIEFLDDPPVATGTLQASVQEFDTQSEDVVFERRGTKSPRLIAVSWPYTASRFDDSGPTGFVVFFHANMAPRQPDYYTGPYPWDFDYAFYGLWNYLNFRDNRNQLTDWPHSFGLSYQLAFTRKPAVLVLPCSSAADEIGSFSNATDMLLTLREVEASMFRRMATYVPPGVGRVAVAGYSQSCDLVSTFLTANKTDAFVRNNVAEVYGIDPPVSSLPQLVTAAVGWSVGRVDTCARIYLQGDSPALAPLIAPTVRPAGAVIANSPDGRATIGYIPESAWVAAGQQRGTTTKVSDYWERHAMFASFFLTESLRRSQF
jgi:hypothetical protein